MARKISDSDAAASARKQEKQDARRREIIRASRDLFFEASFDNVSIRDLEKATGLTRGAIYYYFENKEDIYGAVVIEGLERVRNLLLEASGAHMGDPKAQLVAIYRALAEHYFQERQIFDNLLRYFFGMRPTATLSAQLLQDTEDQVRMTQSIVEGIIAAGNDSGVFDCDDPEFAGMAIWGVYVTMIQMAGDNERLRAVSRPRKVLVKQLEEHILHIVGARS
ncbi:MAG: TetR/AcrR family transcriptional regulator [Hyphomonas sp.]|nr:TetR/AcrR family transcriptional regulator [Hyphomonas sp.]